MRNRRADTNDRPQGPQERDVGQGEEKRKRGPNAPLAGGEVVPELVNGEDTQQCGRKRNTLHQVDDSIQAVEGTHSLLDSAGSHHGEQRQHEEGDVREDTAVGGPTTRPHRRRPQRGSGRVGGGGADGTRLPRVNAALPDSRARGRELRDRRGGFAPEIHGVAFWEKGAGSFRYSVTLWASPRPEPKGTAA